MVVECSNYHLICNSCKQVIGQTHISVKAMNLAVLILGVLFHQCLPNDAQQVSDYCVKPTGPTTECGGNTSCEGSPCHSLEYYASHSNFTNNSRFLFLEGEHHLDTFVEIRNVANLTLVGASSGVKIVCKSSLSSGFLVTDFNGLTIDNMVLSYCSELRLVGGSDASHTNVSDVFVQGTLSNVVIANCSLPLQQPLILLFQVLILFVNCTFENNFASIIQTNESKIIFQGENIFRNNSALVGGAIFTDQSSYMYLRPQTHILFESNHAYYVGGAIYSEHIGTCFFYLDVSHSFGTTTVNFVDNTADYAGSSLYGTGINLCCMSLEVTCTNFSQVFNVSNTEADPSAIASEPNNVCLCGHGKNQPDCSPTNRKYSTHVYPGQTFSIRLAVVGLSFYGVVPAAIRAYLGTPPNALRKHQYSQVSDKPRCKNFYYSVNSTEHNVVRFKLSAEHALFKPITGHSKAYQLNITVYLKDCPQGFSLSPATGICVCDHTLNGTGVQCDINNQSFLSPASSWIGFIDESSINSNKTGVIFYPNCPIGYCLSHDVSITSNTSDDQCEPHGTGVLCGKCKDGYSLTLGNGKCAKCSNTYLLLILPLAVAGLLLVAILFALNLTVTEGSINGLIFYANVIVMNNTTRLSGQRGYLYIFLAWLNLDLGINTCLFKGMDGYAETWLQFIFPIYMWMIILLIIQFYRKFPNLAGRLGGKNAVKVLATLLLLSYTKLQRTVVTILSYARLEYPGGVVRYVWLYDANLEFFKGKHLYLGMAGILVLVFLIIPYTLCLAFFKQLQACSGHMLFQWVNKLKPVLDSYAGPYKDKYRFWTGMLLVVRTLLIILSPSTLLNQQTSIC